jgi:hypothetical protein
VLLSFNTPFDFLVSGKGIEPLLTVSKTVILPVR